MHDDSNQHGSSRERRTAGDSRDLVGELINAVGRRPEPPADAYEQVFDAAHASWRQALRSRRRRHWQLATAAAVAAITVGLTLVLRLDLTGAAPTVATVNVVEGEMLVLPPAQADWQLLDGNASIVAGSRIRSGSDARAALSISGSSSLRVNADSELLLEAPGTIRLRSGTVYFDTGAAATPGSFEVITPFGAVRDIGTQFEVSSTEERLRVRVREGAVELDSGMTDAEVAGAAGEQIELDADGVLNRSSISPFDPAWSWAESLAGAPQIEGQSVLQFLSWVARESGRELRFDTSSTEMQAQGVTLHGRSRDLPPLQALDAILATTDFQYSLLADGIILVTLGTRMDE